jgi:hypothetical protein
MRFYLVPGVIESSCSPPLPAAGASTDAPVISLAIYDQGGRVGVTPYTTDEILEGRVVRIYPKPRIGGGHEEQELVFGVVPDGISSVEVKAGEMPGRVVSVRGNFFEAQVPTGNKIKKTVTSFITFITWYDTVGRRVKTITRTDRWMTLLSAPLT